MKTQNGEGETGDLKQPWLSENGGLLVDNERKPMKKDWKTAHNYRLIRPLLLNKYKYTIGQWNSTSLKTHYYKKNKNFTCPLLWQQTLKAMPTEDVYREVPTAAKILRQEKTALSNHMTAPTQVRAFSWSNRREKYSLSKINRVQEMIKVCPASQQHKA